MNRIVVANELLKVAKELMAIGGRHVGLPGARGEKAHHWFVVGNAAAANRKPANPPAFLSKACADAYQRGYDLGLEQKKEKR
jgi:hypothetical protein